MNLKLVSKYIYTLDVSNQKTLMVCVYVHVYYHSCHGNQISSPRLSHSFTVIQVTFFSSSFFTDTV